MKVERISPYPLPTMLVEPSLSGPEGLLSSRLAAGIAHGRDQGCKDLVICLNRADAAVYRQLAGHAIEAGVEVFDGAQVEQIDEGGVSYFRGQDAAGAMTAFPVLSDEEFERAFALKPGMWVLLSSEMTPREVEANVEAPDEVLINGLRYGRKAEALDRKAPSVDYAWDRDAMEVKAERNLLTDAEKTFFAGIMANNFAELLAMHDAQSGKWQ